MSKYMWVGEEFKEYVEQQVKECRAAGLTCVGTLGATQILLDRVLIPNEIKLIDVLKPHIKIKNGKRVLCSEI